MGNNNATKPDQKQGKNNELPVETKPRNKLTSLFRNPIVKSDFFQLKANAFFLKNNETTHYKDYDGGHSSHGGCTTCCDTCPNSQQASSARRDPHQDPRFPPKNEGSRRRGSMSCDAPMEYNDNCHNQRPHSDMHKNQYNDSYYNPPDSRDHRYNDRYHNSQPPESETRERCCCDSTHKKQKKPKLKPQPRDPPPYELSCRRKSIPPARNQSCNDLRHHSPNPQHSRREREVYSDSSYCYGGPCSSRHAAYNSSPPPPPPPKPKHNPRRTHSQSDCECKGKKRRKPRQPADCATDYMEYRDFKTLAHYSPLVVKSTKTPPKTPPKTAAKTAAKDKQECRSYPVSRKPSITVVCDCQQGVDSIQHPYPPQQRQSNESLPPPPRPPSKHYPVSRSASGYRMRRDNSGYKNYPQTSSNRNEFSRQSSRHSPNSRGQMSPQPRLKSSRTPTKNKSQKCQNIGLNTDHVGPVQCMCNLSSNGAKKKAASQSKRGGGGVSSREVSSVVAFNPFTLKLSFILLSSQELPASPKTSPSRRKS